MALAAMIRHDSFSKKSAIAVLLFIIVFGCVGQKCSEERSVLNQTRVGRMVIGHEVRSFRPCDSGMNFWIAGDSPALQDLITAHQHHTNESQPYLPLVTELRGYTREPPMDGFGADYDSAIVVYEFVNVMQPNDCAPEL
jgi:hypothetical protein